VDFAISARKGQAVSSGRVPELSCSVDLYDRCLLLAGLRRDDLNDKSGDCSGLLFGSAPHRPDVPGRPHHRRHAGDGSSRDCWCRRPATSTCSRTTPTRRATPTAVTRIIFASSGRTSPVRVLYVRIVYQDEPDASTRLCRPELGFCRILSLGQGSAAESRRHGEFGRLADILIQFLSFLLSSARFSAAVRAQETPRTDAGA
jgi:hypothetical protein